METQIIMTSALLVLLLMAAWQDIRHYRIKNALVITGALVAIIAHTVLSAGIGFYMALLGWLTGLALLLPLYLLRVMGAGDVKLMAMVGAFLGPQAAVIAGLYILITGGVLSVLVALCRGQLSELFARVHGLFHELAAQWRVRKQNTDSMSTPDAESQDISPTDPHLDNVSGKMPYGVAIAVGTLVFLAIDTKFLIL